MATSLTVAISEFCSQNSVMIGNHSTQVKNVTTGKVKRDGADTIAVLYKSSSPLNKSKYWDRLLDFPDNHSSSARLS